VANVDEGARYAASFDGAGITVVTFSLPALREDEVAVMLEWPSSELVVSGTRTEMFPAGIVTNGGTETMSGVLEESWTMMSEKETAGCAKLVARPTSNTL